MGSFIGIKMDQYWMDLFLWEKFLNEHDIKLFVELGTGYGGMTSFLALQCAQRGIKFMTFDNIGSVPMTSPVPTLLNLGANFFEKDIFSDEGSSLIANSLNLYGHPACIFCDDGDKPREWKTFFPHLAVGDYMAVHDWGVEFKAEDVIGVATKLQESEPREAYKTVWFTKAG